MTIIVCPLDEAAEACAASAEVERAEPNIRAVRVKRMACPRVSQ